MPSAIVGARRSVINKIGQGTSPYGIYILLEETVKKPVMKLIQNIFLGSDEWYKDVKKG